MADRREDCKNLDCQLQQLLVPSAACRLRNVIIDTGGEK